MANEQLLKFLQSELDSSLLSYEHYEAQGSTKSAPYEEKAEHYKELIKIIKSIDNKNDNKAINSSIYIAPQDIEGLPAELLAQLNIGDAERQEFDIIDTIDNAGGMASIDKILVGYYRKTNEILERNKLMSKLYRMTVKGTLYSHPNKKGVYCTKPVVDSRINKEVEDED